MAGTTSLVATIVIVVKNGMPVISQCLSGVFKQVTPWPFEVLVIDSGSTDGTLEVVRQFPVRLIEIPSNEFNHGDTRNLGAENARGKYVVFLVSDAIPYDEHWLARLVEATEEENVAGAFSRHVAHPEHNLLVQCDVENWWANGRERVIKSMPSPAASEQMSPQELYEIAFFTDVSSCLRRDVWARYPYPRANLAEDVGWSKRVLEAGYRIAYEPASIVYHSHERSLVFEFKRAYIGHQHLYRLFGLNPAPSFVRAFPAMAWQARHYVDWVFASECAFGDKLKWAAYALLLAGARSFGMYFGVKAERARRGRTIVGKMERVMEKGI